MNISRKSWHYKLIDLYIFDPSESLCVYFWQVILFSLISLLLVVFVCTAIWMIIITPIFSMLWALPVHGFEYAISDEYAYSGLVGSGIAMFTIEAIVMVMALLYYVFKKLTSRTYHILPDFASEYVKAKKEKVCPRIIFK